MKPKKLKAARGLKISCHGWHQEAALRMLNNNLDPEVAEEPEAPEASSPRWLLWLLWLR